jgi:hypothetical protein
MQQRPSGWHPFHHHLAAECTSEKHLAALVAVQRLHRAGDRTEQQGAGAWGSGVAAAAAARQLHAHATRSGRLIWGQQAAVCSRSSAAALCCSTADVQPQGMQQPVLAAARFKQNRQVICSTNSTRPCSSYNTCHAHAMLRLWPMRGSLGAN